MTTVYDFELPRGFVDSVGEVHRRGKMRLATAGDEINATRDPRVLANPSYLTIVILASGRKAPRDLEERCAAENICVACVAESIFGTCRRLSELGIEG